MQSLIFVSTKLSLFTKASTAAEYPNYIYSLKQMVRYSFSNLNPWSQTKKMWNRWSKNLYSVLRFSLTHTILFI